MEVFNGLNVPPTSIDWEELQEKYCEFAHKCTIGSCKGCLYFKEHLNEFKTWYKSNLKNIKNDN
ncbi:hypothetical protein [Saccharicrinis fermentans]|uniref:hypothetical protein n=1 Tax=Saccharicrinis fermentans TaxID=982 RepID=UPI000488E8F1|nr:hypothetical protein [Saccharicrinis fermentans]